MYKKRDIEKEIVIAAFLIIPIILLVLFSYYPAIKLFELSFSDWNGYSAGYNYVGLDNFKNVLSDPSIFKVLLNNLAYIVIMIVQVIMGLYLAIILDDNLMARNFFKLTIFMPYILNSVAIVFIFNFMYNYDASPINRLLGQLGLNSVRFLSEGYMTNFSLAFIGLWQYVGFNMIIFLAAIQSIPREQYEAAKVDGANWFHKIRHITIPSIKRTISIALILGVNGALQAYVQSLLITPNGGPGGISDTFVTKTLTIAMKFQNFGKASAMGVVLLAIILLIVAMQRIFLKEEEQ